MLPNCWKVHILEEFDLPTWTWVSHCGLPRIKTYFIFCHVFFEDGRKLKENGGKQSCFLFKNTSKTRSKTSGEFFQQSYVTFLKRREVTYQHSFSNLNWSMIKSTFLIFKIYKHIHPKLLASINFTANFWSFFLMWIFKIAS